MSILEDGIDVSSEYLSLQKRTIKELQNLLKMRLRTELVDSSEILLTLNQQMFKITDFSDKIEHLYLQLNKKQKLFQENSNKAKKYDDLLKRINDIEQLYKQKNNDLLEKITELEKENTNIKQQNIEYQEKYQKQNYDYLMIQNDLKSNEQELNKMKSQNEILKKQSSNLNSLLKQVNEEKDFNSQKMTDVVDVKIKGIKDELMKVKNQYQQRLEEKEMRIEKLERELDLCKKELELNQEFTFLQSSGGSIKRGSPDKSTSRGGRVSPEKSNSDKKKNAKK